MNIAAIDARTSPRQSRCAAAVWARRTVTVARAADVAAFETWLQAPVQPVLDAYPETVLSRASSISAALFRQLPF